MILTFVFDDGYETVYKNAKPLFDEKGIVGCVAVISDKINVTNYLSKDQLVDLNSSGWEIMSHTKTHPLNLKELDKDKTIEELSLSKYNIEKLLNVSVDNFVYPCHSYSNFTIEVAKQYYKSARAGEQKHNIKPLSLYNLNSLMIDDYTLDYYYKCIDNCKADNGWLIMYSHLCYSPVIKTTISQRIEILKNIIKYAQFYGIKIETMRTALTIFK